jgi:hypothetical protein
MHDRFTGRRCSGSEARVLLFRPVNTTEIPRCSSGARKPYPLGLQLGTARLDRASLPRSLSSQGRGRCALASLGYKVTVVVVTTVTAFSSNRQHSRGRRNQH